MLSTLVDPIYHLEPARPTQRVQAAQRARESNASLCRVVTELVLHPCDVRFYMDSRQNLNIWHGTVHDKYCVAHDISIRTQIDGLRDRYKRTMALSSRQGGLL